MVSELIIGHGDDSESQSVDNGWSPNTNTNTMAEITNTKPTEAHWHTFSPGLLILASLIWRIWFHDANECIQSANERTLSVQTALPSNGSFYKTSRQDKEHTASTATAHAATRSPRYNSVRRW
ncbi:hypothetical protein J6590_071342 [Homalodisca vitripennis]|nr:hypothetical protein J6590_071342 [Homalodisca vitripennis]